MTPQGAVNKLLTNPERYVFGHDQDGYANGYVDALLDVLRELGIPLQEPSGSADNQEISEEAAR